MHMQGKSVIVGARRKFSFEFHLPLCQPLRWFQMVPTSWYSQPCIVPSSTVSELDRVNNTLWQKPRYVTKLRFHLGNSPSFLDHLLWMKSYHKMSYGRPMWQELKLPDNSHVNELEEDPAPFSTVTSIS